LGKGKTKNKTQIATAKSPKTKPEKKSGKKKKAGREFGGGGKKNKKPNHKNSKCGKGVKKG